MLSSENWIPSAREALAAGLISEVVPGDALLARAREIAAEFVESRPEVLAAAKRALLYGEHHDMAASMQNEQDESAALRRTRSS